ncbi:CapA family protein [Candidatus Gracilibacteria bacterium]|nr:CapA family protein [Candidatus Gracilibacteria bacterium]
MPRTSNNKKPKKSAVKKLPKKALASAKSTKPAKSKKKVVHATAPVTSTWHEFYVKKEVKPVDAGSPLTGVEKIAQSKSSEHVFYRVRTFVGWMFVIVGLVGIVALISNTASSVTNGTASVFNRKSSDISFFGAPENKKITIVATGDILFARYVETQMRKRNDYTWPFKNVATFLNNADITFGNLETPILPGKTTPTSSTTFRSDAQSVDGLAYAGYDVISVSNNHTMNFKEGGLLNAIAELNKRNIKPIGGGVNQDAAHAPAIIEVNGKKVAFYAYTDPGIPGYLGFVKGDQAGIARMDIETVKNDVANAKRVADIVIVSMHAGVEYKHTPTKFQQDFAHAAIDAGASVVIGHHPHVTESVERYGNGVIMYSLGNFVFDQYFSQDVRTGLVAKITLDTNAKPENMVHVEFYPSVTDNLSVQPRILDGEERVKTLEKFGLPLEL